MVLDKVPHKGELEQFESVVVRFAGDSGDGIQLTGSQFTVSTALAGSDLSTFPDFPAEIRGASRDDIWRFGLPDQFRFDRDHDRWRRAGHTSRPQPRSA